MRSASACRADSARRRFLVSRNAAKSFPAGEVPWIQVREPSFSSRRTVKPSRPRTPPRIRARQIDVSWPVDALRSNSRRSASSAVT